MQVISQALITGVPSSVLQVALGVDANTVNTLAGAFQQTQGNAPGSICGSNPSFPST